MIGRFFRWCLVGVACALAVTIPIVAERFQNPSFLPTQGIPNGAYYQVLAADLRSSGRQDLVYWSQAGTQAWYHVMRNEGQRQFTDLGQVLLPGSGISEALIDDFNEDGKPDLVFISWYQVAGYTLWFLPGNGDGTFGPLVETKIQSAVFPSFYSDQEFFASHLNKNGHLDLVMSSIYSGGSAIDVLMGDGTGKFSLETSLQYTPQTLEKVVDVNGDGLGDLVLWNYGNGAGAASNTIQIYMNQGGGKFNLVTAYTAPLINNVVNQIRSAVFADMNGDGIPDLVWGNGIYLYLATGNGDGTFQQSAAFPFSTYGWLVEAQDLNGDGNPDLIVEEEEGIAVLLKGSDFTFTPLNEALAGGVYRGVAVADIDGDGNLDVAVSNALPNGTYGVSLLWGQGGGKLDSAVGYRAPGYLAGASLANFTLGPVPDIAVVELLAPFPLTFKNQGDGTFKLLPDPNPYVAPTYRPAANIYDSVLQSGDFNGDGMPDLLEYGTHSALNGAGYTNNFLIQSLAGNGNGLFAASQVVPGYSNTQQYKVSVAGDLNGDGASDIAVIYAGQIDILLSQKGGGWKLSQSLTNTDYSRLTQTLFGEWNKDGVLDIALVYASDLQVYIGNGDGTFKAGQHLTLPPSANDLSGSVGDVDGDGNADLLLLANSEQHPIYGNGDGTFAAGAPLAIPGVAPGNLLATRVADVNLDGIPDLVLLTSQGIIVQHGLGNRAWDQGDFYISGGNGWTAVGLWVVDLNQDGYPDIALVNTDPFDSPIVSVLLNEPGLDDLKGTLTVTPEPQTLGGAATATLTLTSTTPAPGNKTVQFTIDSVAAGNGTLSSGTVSISLIGAAQLQPGSHSVTATYPGDAAYHATVFTAPHVVLAAVKIRTTTTLTAAPTLLTSGSSLALTATVTPASGATPTGTVTFLNGSTSLGSAPLNASGVAVLTLQPAVGVYSLTASYGGSASDEASSSSPAITVNVNASPTTTTLTASASSLAFGQSLGLTASVTSTSGASPTGTVTFFNGSTSLGTASLNSNGMAILALQPAVGIYSLTARYSGSIDDAASESSPPLLVSVIAATTATTLGASPNPATFGAAVTFSAKVASPTLSPQGGVSFFDGSVLLADSPMTAGVATLSSGSLAVGSHKITAVYTGAAGVGASTSNVIDEVIIPADFSISASPGSLSVYTGEAASYKVTVAPGSGFTLPVSLTCSTAAANTACSFSSATINSSGTSTLVVQTSAPHSAVKNSAFRGGFRVTALASLLLIFIPRRLRRNLKCWPMVILLLVLVVTGIAGVSGCGGSLTLTEGTPVGTQTVAITASATNGSETLTHQATVTLNVKALF